MSDIGVMVCGHGSRDEHIRERLPHHPVESGFLEFATPIIRDGLDKLRAAGCRRVLAVPGMLFVFAAGHAKNDIPAVLNTYQAQHPEMSIDYGRELAIDAKLINAAADRVREALAEAGDGVPAHETLLMVVGRGASDPDANSNVASASAGARPPTPASPFRWSSRASSTPPSWATGALSSFPISFSPGCW
jgi:sirohydrochlorin cobaltochelatase